MDSAVGKEKNQITTSRTVMRSPLLLFAVAMCLLGSVLADNSVRASLPTFA
jgi:hypothetical protein